MSLITTTATMTPRATTPNVQPTATPMTTESLDGALVTSGVATPAEGRAELDPVVAPVDAGT